MMRISGIVAAILATAACGVSSAALAQASATNPVGFYAGAGLGTAYINNGNYYGSYGCCSYYNNYQFAWQGVVGIRPIRVLGVEGEYIDFGTPGGSYYNYNYNSSTHPTAPAVFAVG